MGKNYSDQLTPMRRGARAAPRRTASIRCGFGCCSSANLRWILDIRCAAWSTAAAVLPPHCAPRRRQCIVGWFSGRPVEAKLK